MKHEEQLETFSLATGKQYMGNVRKCVGNYKDNLKLLGSRQAPSGARRSGKIMYVYTYVYTYTYIHIYIYTYTEP